MEKQQKAKEKRSRALKCFDAHLKSSASSGYKQASVDNGRARVRHSNSAFENSSQNDGE